MKANRANIFNNVFKILNGENENKKLKKNSNGCRKVGKKSFVK